MLQYKYKDVGVNMEDEELVKMFNFTLKIKDIGLDTCAKGR